MTVTLKNGLVAALALAAAGFSGASLADTKTAQFAVNITIQRACTVSAGVGTADIDFATVSAQAGDQQANNSGKIEVNCSKTTPYAIGLTPSNSNNAGAGVMTGTDTIAYQLRSASGMTGNVWGDQTGNDVDSNGTGDNQTFTAYATIAGAALNVTPGAYSDTVTVTVTY